MSLLNLVVVVQSLSGVWLFATPGLKHARLPCPSLSPGVCSSSRHSTISSSATLFSFCFQSSPGSGSFPMSWLFASGGQSIEASASVLQMNIQGWFPLGLTDLISLQSKGLLWIFFSTKIWRHHLFGAQPSLWSSSHIHIWLLEKPELWLYRPLSAKWHFYFLIHCLGLSEL